MSTETTAPTRHVQRPAATQGGLTHCTCGRPWPCQHSAEGRWKALKDYLGQQIDADDKVHRGFLADGDLAAAAPFGGLLAANRNTLGKMAELEQ